MRGAGRRDALGEAAQVAVAIGAVAAVVEAGRDAVAVEQEGDRLGAAAGLALDGDGVNGAAFVLPRSTVASVRCLPASQPPPLYQEAVA